MAKCVLSYCKNEVEDPRFSCSYDCYARWIYSHPHIEDQMVILVEGGLIPTDINLQPWFADEIERRFG